MAKPKTETLSNAEYIVAQLRNIATGNDEPNSARIRLQALDRLATITGVYRVEKSERQEVGSRG